MNTEEVQRAWMALAQEVRTDVLLTLRNGRPFGSHAPYLFGSNWTCAYLYLSRLTLHTQHLRADSRVSLFVAIAGGPEKNPLSLKRMNLLGEAGQLPSGEPSYLTVKKRYLARFPAAAPTVGFSDFSLWELRLEEAHLVLGFGRALISTVAEPSTWSHQRPEQKFPTAK